MTPESIAVSVLPRTVITNCTTRKAAGPTIGLAQVGATGGVLSIARRWKALVHRTPPQCLAADLYKGRSIVDAAASAMSISGSLYVVSAGLGLVSAEDPVPNYDLTVVPGSALAVMLDRQGLNPDDWWTAISRTQSRPLSTLLVRSTAFLALPSNYLRLVREDLAFVPPSAIGRLRIFTSEAGRSEVPDRLARCVMPYDERLETVAGFDGTRADFPQRALRHFVDVLRGHRLSLAEGRRAVEELMTKQRRRTLPTRTRRSDDEIRALLGSRWDACAGSSTRLLRYLRDDARVSCEQSRFRALWQTVAAEQKH